MGRPFDYIKNVTPGFMKALYRRSRHAVRTALPSFTKVLTVDVRGVMIRVGVSSELEQYRAETYSTKEPETLDWLEQNLKAKDTFFDVGANIGLYSLYAAKINPKCRIYSFEPAASNFLKLCEKVVLNALTNVIPCNFPLSDLEAFELFYVSSTEPGSALHSLGHVSEFRTDANTPSLIQGTISVTLDALIEKYGVPKPALLKIDVDGLEEKILDGAGSVVKSEKLRTILIELSIKKGSAGTDVERRLAHFGYKLSRKSEWVFELNNIISQNYIFGR